MVLGMNAHVVYFGFILSLIFHTTAPVVFTEQPGLDVSMSQSTPTNTVTISCKANSTPVADIKWFQIKGDSARELVNSSRAVIRNVVQGEHTVRSTLQLSPIEDLRITGFYCKGDNGFNETRSELLNTLDGKSIHPYILWTVNYQCSQY